MSPTWARKGSKRWRYYVSQAALQGDKSKAGSIVRVPAADVEALVAEALGKLSSDQRRIATDIRDLIDRVAIGRATIRDPTVGGCRGGRRREDIDASVDAALALSQARDHPGRSQCEDHAPARCAPTRARS